MDPNQINDPATPSTTVVPADIPTSPTPTPPTLSDVLNVQVTPEAGNPTAPAVAPVWPPRSDAAPVFAPEVQAPTAEPNIAQPAASMTAETVPTQAEVLPVPDTLVAAPAISEPAPPTEQLVAAVAPAFAEQPVSPENSPVVPAAQDYPQAAPEPPQATAPISVWDKPQDPLASGADVQPPAPVGFAAGADQMPSSTGWGPQALSDSEAPVADAPAQLTQTESQPGSPEWQQPASATDTTVPLVPSSSDPAVPENGVGSLNNQAAVPIPPGAGPVPVIPQGEAPSSHGKGLSKWMLVAGGITVLLIITAIIYFVAGAGKPTSSLPAVNGEQTSLSNQAFLPSEDTSVPVPTTAAVASPSAGLTTLSPTPATSSATYGPSARELLRSKVTP